MARSLKVEIIGDPSSLQRALGSAGKSADTFGSKFAKMGKIVGLAAVATGAAIAGGFVYTLKRGFDELADSQKVMAQTQAVIKSTGGVANVSAKQVDTLATSLSKMSGVDDEVIGAGENMLLTFKNIRNETGKGNDVFNQSTKALLDMSTALGTDMNKSAIQLGKALNDPIKGITALTRVGVTFTAGQKESIKAMVDAGDTMGAQKLILKELNSEFGGSAKAFGETMPGQLAKLKNAFDEVAGNLATKFLPILTGLVAWINDNWASIAAVFDAVGTAIIASFDAIGVAVDYLKGQWEIHRTAVLKVVAEIKAAIVTFVKYFQTDVAPAINTVIQLVESFWERFGSTIMRVAGQIVSNVKIMVQNMMAPMKIIIDLLRGDWSAAWEEAKGVVTRTFGGIVSMIGNSVKTIALLLGQLVSTALVPFRMAFESMAAGITGALSKIRDAIIWLVDKGIAVLDKFKNALVLFGKAAALALAPLAAAIGGIIRLIETAISLLGQLTNPMGGGQKIAPGGDNPPGGIQTAAGGIFNHPALRLIGEAGPEAVIPLSRLDSMMGARGQIIHTHVYLDKREIALAVSQQNPRLTRAGYALS